MSFVYFFEKSEIVLRENPETAEPVKLLIEELLRSIRRQEEFEKEEKDSLSIKRINGR